MWCIFYHRGLDLDEAVKMASMHPGAHVGHYLGGGIEVRPCEAFDLVPDKGWNSRGSR